MKRIVSFFLLLLLAISSVFAAGENGDMMYSNGKFSVVTAVIISIFIGIILLMISVERRLARLEKEAEE
jgi:uncharacterized membrane protein